MSPIAREIERLERRLPWCWRRSVRRARFVGLFGTVWGIMSSFQSIAASKKHLSRGGGPGHRGGAFATAIGLIAAIPATIFYNKFTSEVKSAGPAAGRVRRRIFQRSCRARSDERA